MTYGIDGCLLFVRGLKWGRRHWADRQNRCWKPQLSGAVGRPLIEGKNLSISQFCADLARHTAPFTAPACDGKDQLGLWPSWARLGCVGNRGHSPIQGADVRDSLHTDETMTYRICGCPFLVLVRFLRTEYCNGEHGSPCETDRVGVTIRHFPCAWCLPNLGCPYGQYYWEEKVWRSSE